MALPEIVTMIAKALPTIIEAIVNGLTKPEALNALIMGAIQLFLAIIEALPVIIVALVNALPTIISNIVKTLTSTEFINMMINASIQLFMAIIKAIPQVLGSILGAVGKILSGIGEVLSPGNLARIGGDLVKGLWNGISDLGGWVIGKIKGFGEGILNGIKSFFGIHSPSTVFANIGRDLDRGLAKGITDNAGLVSKAVDTMADGALTEMTMNPNIGASMSTTPMSTVPTTAAGAIAGMPQIVQNNDIYNQVDLDAVTRDLAWQVRR